jgi:hypothetical protein
MDKAMRSKGNSARRAAVCNDKVVKIIFSLGDLKVKLPASQQ